MVEINQEVGSCSEYPVKCLKSTGGYHSTATNLQQKQRNYNLMTWMSRKMETTSSVPGSSFLCEPTHPSKEYLSQRTLDMDERSHLIEQDKTRDIWTKLEQTVTGSALPETLSRRKYTLVLCTFATFLTGCSFSAMGPFYPSEAGKKGMSQMVVGIVFSVYELVMCILSPFFGKYLTILGAKFMLLSSMMFGGVSCVLFGILQYCPSGTPFIVLSFLCRSFQAIGTSGYHISSFAIVSDQFPDCIITAFGVIETAAMVGFMTGPILGGFLFDVGGFGLPFYIIGGLVMIDGVVMYIVIALPKHVDRGKQKSVLCLLKTPMFVIPMLSVCSGAIGMTFLQPSLANHLEPFGLSTTIIGLFFTIQPLLSCLIAPFLGYLTDAKGFHETLVVVGHVISVLGFFIAGSAIPFLPFEIWTLVVALFFIGLSYEFTLIPAMKCMVLGATEMGFDDSIETYGIVAGIFNTIYFAGGILGPLLGGAFSFNTGAVVVGTLNVLLMGLCFVFFTIRRMASRKL